MRLDDFKGLLKRLPWLRVINFWHRGEPLAAPDFPEMISLAKTRRIYTQTHTNGILLARGDLADRLVSAGLDRISIGIDGADEETYTAIRKGGSLAEIEKGVKTLVTARKEQRSRKPQIVAECLLSTQTREQFRQVKEMALDWGCDKVLFKTFRVSDPLDLEASLSHLPEDEKLRRYIQRDGRLIMNRNRDSCRRLMHSAVVAWDGEVLPCCFTVNPHMSMGNAFKQEFSEIWKGKGLTEFQKSVNSPERDRIPMCRNCTEGLRRLYIPEKAVLK